MDAQQENERLFLFSFALIWIVSNFSTSFDNDNDLIFIFMYFTGKKKIITNEFNKFSKKK